jgi:antitoxin StbD
MNTVLANRSTSITDLKRNPSKVMQEADGSAVVILNHNKPIAYLVPAEVYEELMERLEDAELVSIASARSHEKSKAVKVSLNEL